MRTAGRSFSHLVVGAWRQKQRGDDDEALHDIFEGGAREAKAGRAAAGGAEKIDAMMGAIQSWALIDPGVVVRDLWSDQRTDA